MKVLIGCEESQAVTLAFRSLGIEAYSCDLKPCSGGRPDIHLKMDVFEAISLGGWDMGIFFPDCTYLTCSAEWAYKDPDFDRYPGVGYHQKVKDGTLTGSQRREARVNAVEFVNRLWNSGIEKVAIENPVGKLSAEFMKPSQIIQPYEFGDDASKKTCLWLKNIPFLLSTELYPPRIVDGRKRWGNQTDSGQNNLTPSEGNKARAELRSKTYPGIAKAMAEQWGEYER